MNHRSVITGIVVEEHDLPWFRSMMLNPMVSTLVGSWLKMVSGSSIFVKPRSPTSTLALLRGALPCAILQDYALPTHRCLLFVPIVVSFVGRNKPIQNVITVYGADIARRMRQPKKRDCETTAGGVKEYSCSYRWSADE